MRHLYAGCFFESIDKFKNAKTCPGSEVENLNLVFATVVEHTFDGDDMSLGDVDDVDIVADAGAVGGVVVVAKDAEFFADTHSGLCEEGDEVLWYSVGEFSYLGRGMSAHGIEIAEDDALYGGACANYVGDYLFGNLLGIAVGRGSRFDGRLFGDGVLVGLAIDGA